MAGWHRELTAGDVQVAHTILNTHTRYVDAQGADRCAGLHGARPYGPRWPCSQANWALDALDAETRGTVAYTEAEI